MILMRKPRLLLLLACVLLVLLFEVFCRLVLGLGTPPLYIAHPEIEYMLKPNQDVYRFGNRYIVNSIGMRSSEFPAEKLSGEIRITAFGDSVLNGGSQIDQSNIATSILQQELREVSGKQVIIGNVSAGSWGPGNWLAYVKEYGFFDSDFIVLVLSSHDYTDNPDFLPLNPNTHPTTEPLSAIVEGITRYLPRFLPRVSSNQLPSFAETPSNPAMSQVEQALNDLQEFLILAKKNSSKVLVFQHWEKKELLNSSTTRGAQLINKLCNSLNIETVQLGHDLSAALDSGRNPYLDNIHLNTEGHAILAALMTAKLRSFVEDFQSE